MPMPLALNEKLLAHFLIFIYSNNSMSPAHLFVLSRCLCLTLFSIVLNIYLIFCISIVWESHACETMNEPLKRAFDEWETERNTKKRTKTKFYLHQTGFETEYTIDIAHRARDWSTSTHTANWRQQKPEFYNLHSAEFVCVCWVSAIMLQKNRHLNTNGGHCTATQTSVSEYYFVLIASHLKKMHSTNVFLVIPNAKMAHILHKTHTQTI